MYHRQKASLQEDTHAAAGFSRLAFCQAPEGRFLRVSDKAGTELLPTDQLGVPQLLSTAFVPSVLGSPSLTRTTDWSLSP